MKISESGLVGTSVHRTDVLDKVTGCAVFVDDIQFGPNLLHSRLVRSPYPHALIKSINTECKSKSTINKFDWGNVFNVTGVFLRVRSTQKLIHRVNKHRIRSTTRN